MKDSGPLDQAVVWLTLELAAMAFGAGVIDIVYGIATGDSIGKSMASSTVLLSVAAAIVTQLWLKLNELSALTTLSPNERSKLRSLAQFKIRALIWLLIYFVSFIFFVLTCSALASSPYSNTRGLLDGAGAGFGAALLLLAAVLVDLNEVTQFRWLVDLRDQSDRRTARIVGDLRQPDGDFEQDEHLKSYRKVSGE